MIERKEAVMTEGREVVKIAGKEAVSVKENEKERESPTGVITPSSNHLNRNRSLNRNLNIEIETHESSNTATRNVRKTQTTEESRKDTETINWKDQNQGNIIRTIPTRSEKGGNRIRSDAETERGMVENRGRGRIQRMDGRIAVAGVDGRKILRRRELVGRRLAC